jgi:hypothetical protein
MKKIAISVFSLAAVLLLTLSPALALANSDCCNHSPAAARHAAITITSKADATKGGLRARRLAPIFGHHTLVLGPK